MEYLLTIILFVINIYLIREYYIGGNSIFMAPCQFCLITTFSLGPMLVSLLSMQSVDHNLLSPLLIVMISSVLAFHLGFKKGVNVNCIEKTIRNIDTSKNKLVISLFTLSGIIALFLYKGLAIGLDWVIAGVFQSMGIVALLLSFSALKDLDWRKAKFYLPSLLISIWCIYDFAMNIKGSRTRVFYLLVVLGLFLSRIYPNSNKKFEQLFLWLFIIGSIMSWSIVDYREGIIHGKQHKVFNISNIFQNYNSMLTGKVKMSSNGHDLYNAARYIDCSWRNMDYNWGTSIWNGLIFNFVPQRLVGKQVKDGLMIDLENRKYVSSITHNVTTMTGFGEAFASFSYFGCLIFYIIGYFFGKWWRYSHYSSFYLILYAYASMFLVTMITHGIVYLTSPMFLWWIFMYQCLRKSTYWELCWEKE